MFSSHMWVKPDVWPHFWHLKPSQTSGTKKTEILHDCVSVAITVASYKIEEAFVFYTVFHQKHISNTM